MMLIAVAGTLCGSLVGIALGGLIATRMLAVRVLPEPLIAEHRPPTREELRP